MTRFRPGGTATREQAGPSSYSIPRRLVIACSAFAGVGLVVFALSSLAGSSGMTPTASTVRSYVALGDSFTAGPGIPLQLGPGTRPVAPSGCLRSSDNYPSLTARALGLNLRDASCSGATTRDLTASQGPGIPPQLSLLRSSTSLVSLGIGGNDLGFSTIAENCVAVTPWGATRMGWSCKSHYTAKGVDQLAVAVQRVGSKVATALEEIRARAPRARVFVVGYPDLLPPSGSGCWPVLPFSAHDLGYLRGVETRLDSTLAGVASAAHDVYVDMATPSAPHSACTAAGSRWVDPILVSSDGYPLHPSAVGMAGMARVLERAIGPVGPR